LNEESAQIKLLEAWQKQAATRSNVEDLPPLQAKLQEQLEEYLKKGGDPRELLFLGSGIAASVKSGRLGKELRRSRSRWLHFVELSSRILPAKVRMRTFEPSYADAKADYLLAKQRYKSKLARRWLTFCFIPNVFLMICQCVWGMCSEKLKQVVLTTLPDLFRRFLGS